MMISQMTRGLALLAGGVAALLAADVAQASDAFLATPWIEKPAARLRLLSGADRELKTGLVRTAGIEIDLAPGWKTYWRNPGDAGIPPTIDWQKSRNVASVELRLPAPTRIEDRTGVTYGYDKPVTFPVIVTPVDRRAPVHLSLEIALGVCKDICVPVEATLAMELPADLGPDREAPAVTAAYGRVPRFVGVITPGVPVGSFPAILKLDADFKSNRRKVEIHTRGADDLFVEAPAGLFVPLPKRVSSDAKAKSAVFEIDLSDTPDADDLQGKTLRLTLVGSGGAIEAHWIAR